MTWQEELRKLDEEFSSGAITADEYRSRRDQVLSSAVAPTQQGQPSSTDDSATQIVPTVGQQGDAEATQAVSGAGTDADVDAEATQAVPSSSIPTDPSQASTNGDSNADVTQIVSVPEDDNPEATQVVSGQQADATQHVPGHSAQTQAVPPWQVQQQGFHPQQQHGYQHQQPPQQGGQEYYPAAAQGQHPYGQQPPQQPEDAPLWGGDEFPPIAPPPETDWVTQGPEFEPDSEPKGKTGKVVASVLVVLLLAGIAFGAWWLWGRDSGSPTAGGDETTQEQPPPETTDETEPPEENDPLAVGDLPGSTEEHPEIGSFKDVPKLNYLNDEEISAYRKAGAGDAKFQVQHLSEDSSAPVLLSSASAGREATETVETLRDIQTDNGAEEADDAPEGVYVTEFTDDNDAGQIRAHYVSGNVIVRIEVMHSEGLDDASEDFDAVLQKQLEALPADAS